MTLTILLYLDPVYGTEGDDIYGQYECDFFYKTLLKEESRPYLSVCTCISPNSLSITKFLFQNLWSKG